MRSSLALSMFFLLLAAPVQAKNSVTILAVGDILPAASASDIIAQRGFSHLFAATAKEIESADIAIGNLELPLTDSDTATQNKSYTFKGSPTLATALAETGFDVFTLANNHIGDYGSQGILDTIEALEGAEIATIGAGKNRHAARRPAILERNGIRIAFLGYSNTLPKSFWAKKDRPGTAYGHPKWIDFDVRAAKKVADLVVVSFHWGAERMTNPKEYQIEFAHIAIDAGATIVLGHHPHVLQGVEHYKDGIIFYSLGNFAFGSYSKNARTSMMAKIVIQQRDETAIGGFEASILPLNVFNTEVFFQPKPLKEDALYQFVEEYQQLLHPFEIILTESENGWFSLIPDP